MKILIGFILASVVWYSLSFQKTDKYYKTFIEKSSVKIDTLRGEKYNQYVFYKNGLIDRILVFEKENSIKERINIQTQELNFSPEGYVDSVYMFHGEKYLKHKDGQIDVLNQRSYIYFDSLGNLIDYCFMKDFKKLLCKKKSKK